jgi:hypothetical protein
MSGLHNLRSSSWRVNVQASAPAPPSTAPCSVAGEPRHVRELHELECSEVFVDESRQRDNLLVAALVAPGDLADGPTTPHRDHRRGRIPRHLRYEHRRAEHELLLTVPARSHGAGPGADTGATACSRSRSRSARSDLRTTRSPAHRPSGRLLGSLPEALRSVARPRRYEVRGTIRKVALDLGASVSLIDTAMHRILGDEAGG